MNRDKLKQELAADEGRRLATYRDTAGYWTIGVGHLLGGSPRMSSITDDECDALLERDIQHAEKLARSLVPEFDTMADARQRALVNMAFNRGGHLASSTKILPAIRLAAQTQLETDWSQVPTSMAGSTWAKQVGARAARLGKMFATGLDA